MKIIMVLFACSIVGCATTNQCSNNSCAIQKPTREVQVREHTVWNYANGRMVECTMRCSSGNDAECSVVECQ